MASGRPCVFVGACYCGAETVQCARLLGEWSLRVVER